MKALTAGIPWMPNCAASAWLESTSTLARSTESPRLPASASSAGPSWRHGPHHSAQKSTTTGTSWERSITSFWKLASVTSWTIARKLREARGRPRPVGDGPSGSALA